MGGESGTSHTGAIHYYYICLSKRRKRAKCNMGRVQKQFIEDTVINATRQMFSAERLMSRYTLPFLAILHDIKRSAENIEAVITVASEL